MIPLLNTTTTTLGEPLAFSSGSGLGAGQEGWRDDLSGDAGERPELCADKVDLVLVMTVNPGLSLISVMPITPGGALILAWPNTTKTSATITQAIRLG